MKYSVCITGGHTTPAVAVMEELIARGVPVSYIGRRYAFTQARDRVSFEYTTISTYPVDFIASQAPRFPTGLSIDMMLFPFSFVWSVIDSLVVLTRIKPHAILSFGGYISAPVVLAGWFLKIPVILHEQTMAPGRANRILARFAKTVCISWASAKKYFPPTIHARLIHTGNPLRATIRSLIGKKRTEKNAVHIYVTGGSTGAHRINSVIAELIPDLVTTYQLTHQCGDSHFNDYQKLQEIKDQLPAADKERYDVHKYIDSAHLSKIYASAVIMVGRAGANTVAELVCLGLPAILIPLPEAAYGEQEQQARYMADNQAAVVISQDALTPKTLHEAIRTIDRSYTRYTKHAKEITQSEDAQAHATAHTRIADLVLACIDRYRSASPQHN